MKKIIIGCGILLVIGIGFVFLLFYIFSKPKFKDVTKQKPFAEISNKTLSTKKRTSILMYPGIPIKENYKYHLEDGSSFGMDSDLEEIVSIPIGAEVTIDNVELHTGRVSGTTTAYLFGKIYDKGTATEYPFQYSWGDYHSLYEDNPYWTFELAFWQELPLTQKYYIDLP
ncbi:hypothetical protein [Maribacter sp. Asnod1-A12]|uniref:hypothetical protein n=1 Tax=Maribacter sp. Asnod1-A12 TaxID=3160576 RepID=UPI003863E87A